MVTITQPGRTITETETPVTVTDSESASTVTASPITVVIMETILPLETSTVGESSTSSTAVSENAVAETPATVTISSEKSTFTPTDIPTSTYS